MVVWCRSAGNRAPALAAGLAAVLLAAGLTPIPGVPSAAAGAPSSATQASGSGGDETGLGGSLYAEGCQSCHGIDGRGVGGLGPRLGVGDERGAGPSLRGVDPGTVDLYLSAGYMPLDDPRDAPERSEPAYSPREIKALIAHVVSFGERSTRHDPGPGVALPTPDPDRGSLAEGQKLFTEHCAGCHQVAAEGGVVGPGVAPELRAATDRQVAEAVRAGPYLMPSFSPAQISERQLDSLVAYAGYTRDPQDEGGWGIGHIGPIPEGLVAWIVAAIALVGVARLIGKRTGQDEGGG